MTMERAQDGDGDANSHVDWAFLPPTAMHVSQSLRSRWAFTTLITLFGSSFPVRGIRGCIYGIRNTFSYLRLNSFTQY